MTSPTNLTSSIQVSEEVIEAIQEAAMQATEMYVGTKMVRAILEQAAAMRSKDHSIAVDDVRERVARAIAPRLFYEFDCQTMDRAARWDLQSDNDKETLRLLADDAITAIGSQSIEGERAPIRYAKPDGRIG